MDTKEFVQRSVVSGRTSFFDLVQTGRIRESSCVYGSCPDGECFACLEVKKREMDSKQEN